MNRDVSSHDIGGGPYDERGQFFHASMSTFRTNVRQYARLLEKPNPVEIVSEVKGQSTNPMDTIQSQINTATAITHNL